MIQQVGTRPDKRDPGPRARPGELGVFRQEAVTRMDGINPLLAGQLDDGLDIEVAMNGRARLAHWVSFIGLEPMAGEAILMRVDRHRPNAQLVRRTEDADGDLASIGGHQTAKYGHRAFLLRHCAPSASPCHLPPLVRGRARAL